MYEIEQVNVQLIFIGHQFFKNLTLFLIAYACYL